MICIRSTSLSDIFSLLLDQLHLHYLKFSEIRAALEVAHGIASENNALVALPEEVKQLKLQCEKYQVHTKLMNPTTKTEVVNDERDGGGSQQK